MNMNFRLFEKDKRKTPSKEDQKIKALANSETIKAQLRNLLMLDQRNFARYLISRDPISGKIPTSEISEIIESSIKCGKDQANKLLMKYGNLSPIEIANKLKLNVKYENEQDTMDFIYFGLFESPRDIFIYKGNIKEATSILEQIKANFFNINFNDIVLAHEIFHYIEHHDQSLYSNTRQINLWSLGKLYTHKSSLICTGEIAGMSFAKTLLNLDFDPTILDYIFLLAFDYEKAEALYHKIMKYS
ncbi:MAG: hypothetical protein GX995_02715 [Clostridiales bacterium]|nr:hypothetical protein [Clostridiales bacterium]